MNWKIKSILLAESFFHFTGGLLAPILAIFVEDIGGGIVAAAWAWSIFSISTGITLYIMGVYTDRLKNNSWLIILGYLLCSFAFLGYVFVSTFWHLFLVEALFGLGWALGTPATDAIYALNLPKKKIASQFALWEAITYIFGGIAAIVGGLVVVAFSFKALFIFMFIISLIPVMIALYMEITLATGP